MRSEPLTMIEHLKLDIENWVRIQELVLEDNPTNVYYKCELKALNDVLHRIAFIEELYERRLQTQKAGDK